MSLGKNALLGIVPAVAVLDKNESGSINQMIALSPRKSPK